MMKVNKRIWGLAIITIILGVFISPLASSSPDGLERVAHDLSFIEMEKGSYFEIFPDYSVSFVTSDIVSTSISGLIGILIIGLVTFGIIRFANRRSVARE
ncbi:PDGLE domain-containing protein [Bacillus sp. AK128]